MKKILLFAAISLPFSIPAEIAIQDGYEIQGRIFSVKTAKKYSSVEGCSKYALSKSKVRGFTFDKATQKCTLFKKVRGLKPDSGSVSGTK